MAGRDSASGRVIALIVALLVAGAGLHGYLPPAASPTHREHSESPAGLIPVAAALLIALAILTVAIINRLRERRCVPVGVGSPPDGAGAVATRPTWRLLLIALAVIAAWSVLNALLLRLLAGYRIQARPRPGDAPVGGTGSPSAPTDTGGSSSHPAIDEVNALTRTALTVLALCAIAIAITIAVQRRRAAMRPVAHLDTGASSAGPDASARAAELGLAAITDPNSEPRRAIIACYAAMERRLQTVPGAAPQQCDTPTEVLTRAVERRVLAATHAGDLVALFSEARFSAHPMTERHRDDAVRILAALLTGLRGAR